MAGLESAAVECCSPEARLCCCEPYEKDGCCGPQSSSCGCSGERERSERRDAELRMGIGSSDEHGGEVLTDRVGAAPQASPHSMAVPISTRSSVS